MSIRSEAMPYRGSLSQQLQDLLLRNGMKAQVGIQGDQLLLYVQGHDSPMLNYPISEKQFRTLTDGGTNYSNKKAYATFNSIVGRDFNLPSSYVAARNVNGRVVMGLHGVRESHEYGRTGHPHAFGRDFLGWTPRQQPGFHTRRMYGSAMIPTPMLIEHTDGRTRPGELRTGAYGYYYKGQQTQQSIDPLQEMQNIFPQVVTRPRAEEPAKPYKEMITSDVYFTNEKWQDVLSSHGIIIDMSNKTLTLQSASAKQDFVYDLTDEELHKLTDNSLKKTPMKERLAVLNKVIGQDFSDKITMDTLNSKEHIDIHLRPEVEKSIIDKQNALQSTVNQQQSAIMEDNPPRIQQPNHVDGSHLEEYDERKGWYREGRHGREVNVGDIWVDKVQPTDKDAKTTYQMSAVINGEVISHEISKKQYDKFMAVDDYQRQRMMSKIFSEVDMKTRPEMRNRFNPLAAIAAGLTAVSEATVIGAGIVHDNDHFKHPHSSPTIYNEVHGTGRIYVKPGVDSPQDIASRAFEAGLNQGVHGHGHSR